MQNNGTKDLDLNSLINTFNFGSIEVQEDEPFRLEKAAQLMDALVLINLTTICRSCNTQYHFPNLHLLFRKKKKLFTVTTWNIEMNNLPREVVERQETIPACSNCFERGSFSTQTILGRES